VLVEILTGILFALTVWTLSLDGGPTESALYRPLVAFLVQAWFVSALIVCAFVDLEFRIYPDQVTLPSILIGVVFSALFPFVHRGTFPSGIENLNVAGLVSAIVGALGGAGLVYIYGVAARVLFRKEAVGLGDVKHFAMLGSILGLKGVLITLWLFVLFGGIYAIGLVLVGRRLREVPTSPFVTPAAMLVLFHPPFLRGMLPSFLRSVI